MVMKPCCKRDHSSCSCDSVSVRSDKGQTVQRELANSRRSRPGDKRSAVSGGRTRAPGSGATWPSQPRQHNVLLVNAAWDLTQGPFLNATLRLLPIIQNLLWSETEARWVVELRGIATPFCPLPPPSLQQNPPCTPNAQPVQQLWNCLAKIVGELLACIQCGETALSACPRRLCEHIVFQCCNNKFTSCCCGSVNFQRTDFQGPKQGKEDVG